MKYPSSPMFVFRGGGGAALPLHTFVSANTDEEIKQ